ncbi:MAG: hypothetical protein Q4B09_02835, partial [Lachnospiraceae bacterium]|nr:hypothetical protein [Lachnospiraceae bacterium]
MRKKSYKWLAWLTAGTMLFSSGAATPLPVYAAESQIEDTAADAGIADGTGSVSYTEDEPSEPAPTEEPAPEPTAEPT